MNLIKYILIAAFFSPLTYAKEEIAETSIHAIEVEHFIVNWSPNSQNLGSAIIYPCASCTPTTMTFNKDTILLINGEDHPIEELGSKVDWSGLITTTNQAPTEITQIRIY